LSTPKAFYGIARSRQEHPTDYRLKQFDDRYPTLEEAVQAAKARAAMTDYTYYVYEAILEVKRDTPVSVTPLGR
jgi:hypothetical protein